MMPEISTLSSLYRHGFFLNYGILLFYFTCQFCMIYLAVSGKRSVTTPRETLNAAESPLTFRSFLSLLSFLIQPPKKQWVE